MAHYLVYGGAPVVRPSTLSHFSMNVGVPRRRQLELPAVRRRFIGFIPRFRYRLHRKLRHKLRRGVMPYTARLNSRTSRREIRRWTLIATLRHRRWRKLFQGFEWPKRSPARLLNRGVYYSVRRKVNQVIRHPTIPLGDYVKDYDYRLVGRRRRGERSSEVYRYTLLGGPRPRWCAPFYSSASTNFTILRRDFLRPVCGLLALRPTESGHRVESLWARLQRLHRAQRYARVFQARGRRLIKHTRWHFRKLARAVPRPTRRYLRFMKKRVRRRVVHPHRMKKLFRRTVRRGLDRLHLHRIPLLEANQALYTQEMSYLEMALNTNRFCAPHRVTNTLEYNRFRELPYDLDIKRKKTNNKLYKPRDHPVWGEVLQHNYLAKLEWFKQGFILRLALKNRVDPKRRDPRYNEINNPTAHPLQTGPWSALFWSTVPWARGSYWRTKPVGRAKRVFMDSVNGGLLYEKESRMATTIGLLTTTIRGATLVESDLLKTSSLSLQVGHYLVEPVIVYPEKVPKINPLIVEVPQPSVADQPISAVGWHQKWLSLWWRHHKRSRLELLAVAWPQLVANHQRRRRRRLRWYNTFRFIGWNILGVVHQGRCLGRNTLYLLRCILLSPFWAVRYSCRRIYRWGRNVFRFMVILKLWLTDSFWEGVRNTLFQKRAWRRLRWAYFAWTQVYVSDNFADELINPEADVEMGNWVENDEDDVAVDYGEELESEGAYWNAINPDEWDGYWNHDYEDYFDESREIMGDLLFEELPYYIRLFTQPVVDLVVRLPIWGLLEGVTTLIIWIKREWQILWIRQLTKGGPTTVVLVVLRRTVHLMVWLCVYSTGLSLLSPDDLNLFITYSCGLVFYDEYYVLWWAFVFGLTVWLVGPHPLREYLFRELGPENIGFATLAGIVLCTPEEYYPQRPLSDPIRLYQDRTLGHWSWKPLRRFPTQSHYRGGHGSTYPIYTYDTIQQTVANFNDMQDWPEIDFTDKDPTLWLSPDRSENEWNLPGWPLTDESSENFFWHRHPVYYRNNYMEMVRRDQWWDHDCFEPYFRDELDDSPRNEAIYHQVNTRGHSGHLVNYPTAAKTEYVARPFE